MAVFKMSPNFRIQIGEDDEKPLVLDRDGFGRFITGFVYEANSKDLSKLTVEFIGVTDFSVEPGRLDIRLDPITERTLLRLGWTPPPDDLAITRSPWESLVAELDDDGD